MSNARIQLHDLIIADIREHRPEDSDKAEAIVKRLLAMPQLQSDDNVILFINSYQRAIERRDSGITTG